MFSYQMIVFSRNLLAGLATLFSTVFCFPLNYIKILTTMVVSLDVVLGGFQEGFSSLCRHQTTRLQRGYRPESSLHSNIII